MSDDLVEFLRARLAEDAEVARLAHATDPAPWYEDVGEGSYTNQREGVDGVGLVRAADNVGLWDREASCTLSMTAATATHVARHDPARVLAEVDVKRRMLDEYDQALAQRVELANTPHSIEGSVRLLTALRFVKLLAVPCFDHPDYLAEWRP
ncbi:DUF6221 family protein [Streptomyces sp. H10-C2]|uniref:DUF6221 family protein n=1 Tax=unclassified Streptomyces TaxID=2593676 RepID=UPI0024BA7F6C|nr:MULTISPECIES: DUF6221 family protein [unclassified Streptomyces]MDJ0345226.1 DUF6221 family protein [Streptomyces sp. PH10-H1]MDJ0368828.1 DUF6221 family protein [Streptomyces sp. H10-C2]